jgi:drug/metabolite transporter (DMT)-like permease
MLTWLIVIVLAYFFFSLSSLGDKLILAGPPNPKSYTFYVGLLNILAVFAIPFAGLEIPSFKIFAWIVIDAIVFVLGLYFMFSAVEKFEVSKVATTIGATQPIFIFFASWLFFGYQAMSGINFLAFALLFIGSIIISLDKKLETANKYLKITILTSLIFSLDYVLLKYIFLNFSFLQGFIWTRIFIFLIALLFLLNKSARKEIFRQKNRSNNNFKALFFSTQVCGGIATVLQSFAVSLAPVVFLPILNSLKGVQYVFLFIITSFLSFFFPKILKEKISKKIIFKKTISIVLIVAGLALLIF